MPGVCRGSACPVSLNDFMVHIDDRGARPEIINVEHQGVSEDRQDTCLFGAPDLFFGVDGFRGPHWESGWEARSSFTISWFLRTFDAAFMAARCVASRLLQLNAF